MNDHLQEFAFSSHIFAYICILFGFFLVYYFNGHFLTRKSMQALFDFGKRALAQLSAQQIVAHSFIVRKSSDYLFGRYEKIRRYDNVLGLEAILARVIYIIV